MAYYIAITQLITCIITYNYMWDYIHITTLSYNYMWRQRERGNRAEVYVARGLVRRVELDPFGPCAPRAPAPLPTPLRARPY